MAGVSKRTAKNGEVHWYAVIYKSGGSYHWERLREKNGADPADRDAAKALAEKVDKALKKSPAVNKTAARRIIFRTAWPLFTAYHFGSLAENSKTDYDLVYKAHFSKAPFARMRVSNINHTHIKAYVDSKLRGPKPLSAHTLNNHTAMLATFFKFAHEQGWWDGDINPAKAMGIRQKLAPSKTAYISNPAHAWMLVDYFDKPEDEKYRVLTATLLWSGLRWSELRSLLWSQVFVDDPKHYHLRITTTAVGMDIQGSTKTHAGNRYVGVAPTLAKMLRDWRSNALGGTTAAETHRLGIAQSDGLVFPSDAGTILSPGNYRRRQFADAKKHVHGLDPSFPLDFTVHGCRHTYATNLQRMGATEFQVGRELGHTRGGLGSTAAYIHHEAQKGNPIAAAFAEKSIQEAKKAAAKLKKQGAAPAKSAPVPPAVVKQVKQASPKQTLLAKAAAAQPKTAARKNSGAARKGSATRKP